MKSFNANSIVFGLLVCVFASQPILNAQTNPRIGSRADCNYSEFKSEFKKEFGLGDISIMEDAQSNIDRVFFKTELPGWIFDLPKSNDSMVYVIGVSDPGMSQDSARQLAILRAKAIGAILINSKMNGLSDYYISEKDLESGDIISSVYREFNKIVSSLTFNNADFTIVEKTFTVNNEAVVLASLCLGKQLSGDSTTISCLAEVSSSHVKKNNKYSTTSRMEMMAGEQPDLQSANKYFYYVVKNSNKQIRILSDFSGFPLPVNTGRITYQSNVIDENSKENAGFSCTLQHGLWHALSTVLLQTLALDFQESNVEQSIMGDRYANVTQNINRISNQKEMSLGIKGLRIRNNTLQLETDFNAKDQHK